MEEMISKVDNLFAKVYRELGVSNKDYDATAHGPELHRLTSLHISIKLLFRKEKKEMSNLIKAVEMIKEACDENRGNCKDCPMFDKYFQCCNMREEPWTWDLEAIENRETGGQE